MSLFSATTEQVLHSQALSKPTEQDIWSIPLWRRVECMCYLVRVWCTALQLQVFHHAVQWARLHARRTLGGVGGRKVYVWSKNRIVFVVVAERKAISSSSFTKGNKFSCQDATLLFFKYLLCVGTCLSIKLLLSRQHVLQHWTRFFVSLIHLSVCLSSRLDWIVKNMAWW